jgi:hypothetical protein
MNIDGSGKTQITQANGTDTFYDTNPQFSKQGDRIVFARTPDFSVNAFSNVYTITPDGATVVQVTNATDSAQTGPSFNPDGTLVSFVSEANVQDPTTEPLNGVYTAASAPGGTFTAPTQIKKVLAPHSSTLFPNTYWTGSAGRGTASTRFFLMKLRSHAKKHK